MTYKLFKNANLIDGNGGEVKENVSLLVEDDRIKEIGGSINAPYADEVFDCKGNTVMPGLIDAHMHLGLVEIEVINLSPVSYTHLDVYKRQIEYEAMLS